MSYILDTNIIIDYIRDFKPTVIFVDELITNRSDIYLPTIVNLELHIGQSIENKVIEDKVDALLGQFTTIELDMEIAGLAGDLIRNYQIDPLDSIIAATTLSNNFILVTRNRKHFTKIKNLKILTP